MGWEPCCCTKCTHCNGSTPQCLLIEVSGVIKGAGSANDHLELNGYYPVSRGELSGDACLFRCSRMFSPGLWAAAIYAHSGNFYLGVTDRTSISSYTDSGNPDPPFRVNLGTATPNCFDEFVDIDVPFSTGWHSRQTTSNNAVYSGATVTVNRYKDGMSCWCQRRGNTQLEGSWETVCVSPFAGWQWQSNLTPGICYSGKYPWGGVRIDVTGTDDFDGTFDFVGPPCVIEKRSAGGGAPSIGWLIALPSTIAGVNFLAFMPNGSPQVMTGGIELRFYAANPRQTVKGTVSPLARRYSSTVFTRECLTWDGTQLLDDGDSNIGSSDIDGTFEVSALPYP